MAYHSRHEENDNHSRQQPNRAHNDITWQGQVNSADGENGGNRLPTWLWLVNVIWHFVFFRITEIRDPINTCAVKRSRVSYLTLALFGLVSKCDPRLRFGKTLAN